MANITIRYDEKDNILYVAVQGVISGAEISKSLVKIAEDYKHLSELYVIADYSSGHIEADPTYFLMNLNAVKDTFIKHFSPFKRFVNAYVLDTSETSSTRILLDQFRKVTAIVDAFETEYFDDQESALEWINKRR